MDLRANGIQLFSWLKTETSVTSLLDTINTYPAIIISNMVHEDYQDLDMIQIYRTSVVGATDINPVMYTVNCRSSTDVKADAIAQAVYDAINRKLGNDKLAKCSVSPCIYEDTNHYNTPIDVVVYNNE